MHRADKDLDKVALTGVSLSMLVCIVILLAPANFWAKGFAATVVTAFTLTFVFLLWPDTTDREDQEAR